MLLKIVSIDECILPYSNRNISRQCRYRNIFANVNVSIFEMTTSGICTLYTQFPSVFFFFSYQIRESKVGFVVKENLKWIRINCMALCLGVEVRMKLCLVLTSAIYYLIVWWQMCFCTKHWIRSTEASEKWSWNFYTIRRKKKEKKRSLENLKWTIWFVSKYRERKGKKKHTLNVRHRWWNRSLSPAPLWLCWNKWSAE